MLRLNMKAVIMVLLMCITSAFCQTPKLLKVPRVYNALITSDEMLLPSQAFPAISPVIRGVQYPLTGFFAPGPYQALFSNNQIPNGAVLLDNAGSFSYSVRQENSAAVSATGYKYDTPPDSQAFSDENASLRYVAPVTSTVTTASQNGYLNQRLVGNNKSPVIESGVGALPLSQYQYRSTAESLDNSVVINSADRAEWGDVVKENQVTANDKTKDFVKNNRPTNPDIVDVPPPPLPIGGEGKSPSQKIPEEYPPPPGGFIV